MTTTVRVEGLAELKQVLERTLPDRLQGKALQGALAKAVRPIVQQARTLAPVDTGRLRLAIYSKRSKFSKRGHESRIVAVRRGKKAQKRDRDAFYWKFVEFGHMTRASKKVAGVPRFIPARPFMRPAFEANKLKALEIVRTELAGEIKKVAAREQSRLNRLLRRRVAGF